MGNITKRSFEGSRVVTRGARWPWLREDLAIRSRERDGVKPATKCCKMFLIHVQGVCGSVSVDSAVDWLKGLSIYWGR